VHELTLALKEREFDDSLIEETTCWLKELGYLNDQTFAAELASSRIRNKSWGRKKISFDLAKRGITAALIDSALEGFTEEKETSTAEEAFCKWIKKRGATLPLEKKIFESAFRHLLSRGFPSAIIYRVLKDRTPQSKNDF
jgi:regulatory protein